MRSLFKVLKTPGDSTRQAVALTRTFDALWEPAWNFEYDQAHPLVSRLAAS